MGSAAMLTLTGIAIGLAGAWSASRLLTTLLYEISATDTLTHMSVALILAFVSRSQATSRHDGLRASIRLWR
jgi:putative ABC transport system permease protein